MEQRDFQQIAELVKARFGSQKVDGRKLSKTVKKWAIAVGLLTNTNGKLEFPAYMQDSYIARYQTPLQAVLILMEQDSCFENESIGISVSKRKFWNYLDIYSKGQYGFNESAQLEQEEILIRMHQAGLINFQSAGSIWDIRKG